MELVFNIIALIRELKDHVKTYSCDDILIDTILKKIINIEPQLTGEKLNLEDPIVNANCQSLYFLIAKIQKKITEYKSYNKVKKFVNIGELRDNFLSFEKEMNQIFKNLKLNILIDHTKLTQDLKNHIEDEVSINKEILDIKRTSFKMKVESMGEIEKIQARISELQSQMTNTNKIVEIIKELHELYGYINDFEIKNINSMSTLSNNIEKVKINLDFISKVKSLEQSITMINDNIEKQNEKIIYFNSWNKVIVDFTVERVFYVFFMIIIYFCFYVITDDKIYT